MASIGSITDAKGGGQVKRVAKVMPAARGTGIEKNDTVTTNSQGKFKITFVDSTTVNITENSRLVIDDFVFDGGGGNRGRLGLKVALGTVRYASGAIAHKNPGGVNIRTPTATIGVRGTDFIMSVDEAGRTMVVLLPSCFDDKDPTKITADCPVGAIDVTTAAGTVSMSQPFQTTIVESANAPPSKPTVTNMTGRNLDNSLQITPPGTLSGGNLINQARRDIKRSSDPSGAAADQNAEPDVGTVDDVKEVAIALRPSPTQAQLLEVYVSLNPDEPLAETIHTDISPIFNKKNVQVGWAFSSLSDAKLQSTDVYLPLDTKAQLIIAQDGTVNTFNFSDHHWPTSGTGRPDGTIIINQRGPQ